MVRIFHLKNNYFSNEIEMVSADYSVLGYFDGLSMEAHYEKGKNAIDYLMIEEKNNPYEQCDYFDIVGFRDDEKYDRSFWEKGKNPYIFISCIRFSQLSSISEEIIKKIEITYDAICYTTIDSNDLIICRRTKSFADGYEKIESYENMFQIIDERNKIQKVFSIIAISQVVLDILSGCELERWSEKDKEMGRTEKSNLLEEDVSCQIRCVIKDRESMKEFVDDLEKELGTCCSVQGILGSDDYILHINGIKMTDLLALYGYNRLLTHGNINYKKAFYNVQTEILIERN